MGFFLIAVGYLTQRFLLCSCKLDNGICVSSSFVMLKAWDVGLLKKGFRLVTRGFCRFSVGKFGEYTGNMWVGALFRERWLLVLNNSLKGMVGGERRGEGAKEFSVCYY